MNDFLGLPQTVLDGGIGILLIAVFVAVMRGNLVPGKTHKAVADQVLLLRAENAELVAQNGLLIRGGQTTVGIAAAIPPAAGMPAIVPPPPPIPQTVASLQAFAQQVLNPTPATPPAPPSEPVPGSPQ